MSDRDPIVATYEVTITLRTDDPDTGYSITNERIEDLIAQAIERDFPGSYSHIGVESERTDA